jgi:8-oxo-dGTP pyrophosphatase MutT (NUDIX family)
MFDALPLEVQRELTSLAQRFGEPRVIFAPLDLSEGLFSPLSSRDRYGEVCMVIRRPAGTLLTAKKTFYPAEGHRLLTGGIHPGEPILEALLREVHEETGLTVEVRRFLVAVAYHQPGEEQEPLFYTFAFLLDEIGGTLGSLDPDEQVEYFREIAPADLAERASFLATLADVYSPDLQANWAVWGRFRAIIHRLVWETLQ